MNTLGVDPGKEGAVSWVGDTQQWTVPYSWDEIDGQVILDTTTLDKMLYTLTEAFSGPDVVAIEKVHSMPHDAKRAAFSFGWNASAITHYLRLKWAWQWKAKWVYVDPREWQLAVMPHYIKQAKSFKSKSEQQKAGVAILNKLYPQLDLLATKRSKKPHSGSVDATLLAHYARSLV